MKYRLGMYINENLKWDEYINFMISKLSAKIRIIRFQRNKCTFGNTSANI